MAVTVVLNGVSYTIPDPGNDNWGQNLTDYFVAQASGLLQKAGGAFTLTAETDFGATYGLKSAYFKSRTSTPAAAGAVRLAKTDSLSWRNTAGGGDLALAINGSDQLTFNGVVIQQAAITVSDTSTIDMTLSGSNISAAIIAGSITNSMVNSAAAIAYSKLALTGSIVNADIGATAAVAYSKLALTGSIVNADVSSTAAIAYSKLSLSGSIVNADISAAAAIAFSKLAPLTSAQILVGNGSSVATAVAVSGDISLSNAGVTAYAGTVPATKGGTGLTSGTSGGVPYFSSTTTIASSALLAAHGVLLGGGAGAAPATLAPDASTSKVLVSGGASADPAWSLLTNSNLSGSAGITNANLASVATATFKGRTTAGTGAPEDLTATQATAILNVFTSSLQGLVPASGGGTTTFLRADGSFQTPPGAGDVVGPASSVDNELVLFNSTTGKLIKRAAGTGIVQVTSGVVTQSNTITPAVTHTGAVTLNGGIVGSDGTADATAGNVGQYIEGKVTTPTSMTAASNAWQDATSISLTAGDWDVTFQADFTSQANNMTAIIVGISTTTGNSSTGLVLGDNEFALNGTWPSNNDASIGVVNYRVRISSTTIHYGKISTTYSTTAPKFVCRLSARRVR